MIRIIIPLDGSTVAEEALTHALSISKTFPAEILLLRVVTESDSNAATRVDNVDMALSHHQAQAYLDGLIEKFATDEARIQALVVEGNPSEVIARHISDSPPDLLVLTRYGCGNAQEFAAGGTAQKIVSGADCSILLLDPGRPIHEDHNYHRILVPIDETKDSDFAVAIAVMIANIHAASLILVHVTEEPHLPKSLPQTKETRELISEMQRLIRMEAERRLNEFATKIPKKIPVETRVLVSTDSPLAIESTAEDFDSDLMLLHTVDTHSGAGVRFGSVNQSLIQYSHRPLFILRAHSDEGSTSNFRSVHLDEPCLEAG